MRKPGHCAAARAAVGIAIMMPIAAAGAGVVTVHPSQDNTLYEHPDGALSNGAGGGMFAGTNAGGQIRRGLLAFDVNDAVPSGATILNVTLTLHVGQANMQEVSVGLHRLLSPWGEGASVAPGNGGGGAPAAPGDATWLHASFDDVFWTAAGGDFHAQSSAQTLVGGSGFYTWADSPDLVADVQGWLDGSVANFGWAILGDEGLPSTAKRFDTREALDPALRPALLIEYASVPAPGTIAVLAFGSLGLRGRRRR